MKLKLSSCGWPTECLSSGGGMADSEAKQSWLNALDSDCLPAFTVNQLLKFVAFGPVVSVD